LLTLEFYTLQCKLSKVISILKWFYLHLFYVFASPLTHKIYLFPPAALAASKAKPKSVCPTIPRQKVIGRQSLRTDMLKGVIEGSEASLSILLPLSKHNYL
jgi:hypothetical protein